MPVRKKKASGPTKAQLFSSIAEQTGLTKLQVSSVFDALANEIRKALRGPAGEINALPTLLKIRKAHQKAKAARQGRNPFTQEPMTIKAKSAKDVIRLRALKGLKDMLV